MFILNGKSLFGNTGLIISLVVLVVLLYLSYNKCYNLELFVGEDNKPLPKDVRVKIEGSSVTLNYSIHIGSGIVRPEKFLVVLSQYDATMKNTGNNQFYISNEYEINSGVTADESTYKTNTCSIVNGIPVCQHRFTNLSVLDTEGNPYYYKIGVCAMYSGENTPFVMPYNVTTPNKLFTLQGSAEQQSRLFSDFKKFQQGTLTGPSQPSASMYDNTMAEASGEYELIKSQLGGYPDNLNLDGQNVDQDTLKDLLDKSMAPIYGNIKIN